MASADDKVLLLILDGWGLTPETEGNAPLLAKTPTMDYIYKNFPKTSLAASGVEVGLGLGEPGNSEVGHLNIGLGRVVWENLPRIDQEITSKEFFKSPVLKTVADNVKKHGGTLHLVGLVSDGGVHSHIRHVFSLLEYAAQEKIKNVCIHFISDGRDTPPKKALEFMNQLESAYTYFKIGRTATLIGRYFAMDRDKNWDRQDKAFQLLTENKGVAYPSAKEAIEANYANDKSDEFIEASVIGEGGKITAGDSIIFFNHRSDRMRQLLSLFENPKKAPKDLVMATMTQYDQTQKTPCILSPANLKNSVSEVIAVAQLRQLHTAETEKYAHVTFFLKAGVEKPFAMETDTVVPSKKVNYDKLPMMSAPEVTAVIKKGLAKDYDFIVANYANGDMVGHTGILAAAIKACEAVDKCLLDVFSAASAKKYKVILTADHGNCEKMFDLPAKTPNKEHTTNPVPMVFLDFTRRPFSPVETVYEEADYLQYAVGSPVGVLADVAPSILANLGIPQPEEMTGMDLTVAMQ